jgi:ABC-type Fe3+-citrate transport system substrate-binding protein
MPKIDKLSIDIPPNSLFQPISTDYKNNLTYTEFLLGILKKLNEMIDDINYCEEFIENYAGEIEELQKEFNQLVSDNEQFKIDLEAEINNQLIEFRNQVTIQISTQINALKVYVDTKDAELKAYIDEISLGQIVLYNPITGLMQPLQDIINSMYNIDRADALTATEYDALELTASAYEAYDLTASQYDMDGKSLLV